MIISQETCLVRSPLLSRSKGSVVESYVLIRNYQLLWYYILPQASPPVFDRTAFQNFSILTLKEYQQFTPSQKCHFVRRRGTHLMTIKEYFIAIDLYMLDDFYVEMWHHLDERTVMRINAYKDVEHLTPYLNRIGLEDIEPLLN